LAVGREIGILEGDTLGIDDGNKDGLEAGTKLGKVIAVIGKRVGDTLAAAGQLEPAGHGVHIEAPAVEY